MSRKRFLLSAVLAINLSIGAGDSSCGACAHSWAMARNNAIAHNGAVDSSGRENGSNPSDVLGVATPGSAIMAAGATSVIRAVHQDTLAWRLQA